MFTGILPPLSGIYFSKMKGCEAVPANLQLSRTAIVIDICRVRIWIHSIGLNGTKILPERVVGCFVGADQVEL